MAERAKLRQQHGGDGNRSTDKVAVGAQLERHDRESTSVAAKATGAGIGATQKMAKVLRESPKIFESVRDGKVATITEAQRLTRLPPEEQATALAALDAAPLQDAGGPNRLLRLFPTTMAPEAMPHRPSQSHRPLNQKLRTPRAMKMTLGRLSLRLSRPLRRSSAQMNKRVNQSQSRTDRRCFR